MAKLLGPDGLPISSADQPIFETLNNAWHSWKSSDSLDYIDNTESLPLSTFTDMQDDETVFSGLELLVMMALSRLGDYAHSKDDIAEFVNAQFQGMDGVFTARMGEMMTSAFAYGWATGEKVWRPLKGGGVGLRDIQFLHPDTITLDTHTDGVDKNRLKTIRQFFRQQNAVDIPIDKAVVYTHRGQFGNYYGKSRLKAAHRWWYIKRQVLKAWGICAQRYGVPYTHARVSDAARSKSYTVNGETLDGLQYIGKVLDSMGPKGSVVLGEEVTEFGIEYAPSGLGDCFEQLVSFCNVMIYRALGLPALITDTGKTGSYSLAKQHFEALILTLEHILAEVTDVMIEQVIRPMIVYNFGEQDDWGDFMAAAMQTEDELALADVLLKLSQGGWVDPSRLEDMNWARERIGVPLMDEEDLQPSLPEMPMDPSQAALPPIPPKSFSWGGRKARRIALRRRNIASFTAASKGLRLPA